MSKFTIKKVEGIRTVRPLHKLYKGDRCLYDEFVAEMSQDNNLKRELDKAQYRIEALCNGQRLSPSHFKILEDCETTRFRGQEIKTDNLRVYLTTSPEGYILITGGKKVEQGKKGSSDGDVARFKGILQEYTAQLDAEEKEAKTSKRK